MSTTKTHEDTPLANLQRIVADARLEGSIVETIAASISSGGAAALAVIAFDVDNSAQIRALSIGHKIAVLDQLVGFVREVAPAGATVIGHGTRDDIVVLTPLAAATPDEEALAIAERIRLAVERHRLDGGLGLSIHLTVSGGISLWPISATDALDLMLLAESACRKAKQQGKNRCVLAAFGMDETIEGELAPERLEALVRRSMRTGKPVQTLLREAIQLVLQRHSGLERFAHGLTLTGD